MEEIDYIIKTSVQQLLWLMCTGLQMIGQSVYDLYHDLARSNQSPLATMTLPWLELRLNRRRWSLWWNWNRNWSRTFTLYCSADSLLNKQENSHQKKLHHFLYRRNRTCTWIQHWNFWLGSFLYCCSRWLKQSLEYCCVNGRRWAFNIILFIWWYSN